MQSAPHDDTVIRLTTPSGLLIEATITDNHVLDDFYADYDAAFVLPNEKESRAGFIQCLQLNSGAVYRELVQRYGVFREFVLLVYDPQSGKRIGGANFIAFPLKSAPQADAVLSINLNYIFINPAARKHGYFSQMVNDLPAIAFQLLLATNRHDVPHSWQPVDERADAEQPRTLIFIEQNDPYLLSEADYRLDTEYTGLDQLARIGIWTRLGAKIIDFPYIQPPLTNTQDADPNLVLAVLGTDADTLDCCLLHDHLERFFGISVLKGGAIAPITSAADQLAALRHACRQRQRISLLSAKLLTTPAEADPIVRPASLREALR